MTTVLDKTLKRQVTVDGVDYTVAIDPDGVRVTGKGRRTPEVALQWSDLLSGEAALAVALNASLGRRRTPESSAAGATGAVADRAGKRAMAKRVVTKRVVTKRLTANRATTKRVTTKRVTTKRDTTKRDTTKRGTTKRGTTKRAS